MPPTRHAYGALLLEQGRVQEAAAVYAADLGLDPSVSRSVHHPGNVWSLHGYHECLTRLGRRDEARLVAQQLAVAAARATPVEHRGRRRAGELTDLGERGGGREGTRTPDLSRVKRAL